MSDFERTRYALFARDQFGLSSSPGRVYGDLTEAAIRRQPSHEAFVVGDGRFWISRTFHIGVAVSMLEGPSSAKFHMLYAEKINIHCSPNSQDAISLP